MVMVIIVMVVRRDHQPVITDIDGVYDMRRAGIVCMCRRGRQNAKLRKGDGEQD